MPTMTVDDLLVKVRDAQSKMSRKNAHRVLLHQVEDALIQLARRVEADTQLICHYEATVGELSQVKETTDGSANSATNTEL